MPMTRTPTHPRAARPPRRRRTVELWWGATAPGYDTRVKYGQQRTESWLAVCALAWTLAAPAFGCSAAPAEPVQPTTLQSAESDAASSVEVEPSKTDVSKAEQPQAAEPVVVGWASILDPPTADAERLNREGLALHKRGDHEEAVAKFDASLAESPGFAWGRYNKACALSRLGQTRQSGALMEALLLEDLPRFRPRFFADEDLSALRASPAGTQLEASLPKIAQAYGQVLARGVKAFVYESRAGWAGEEPGADPGEGPRDPQIPYTRLRIGLYDHETNRFVPMVPARRNVYSGLISREYKQAVVAHGKLGTKDMWRVQPHSAKSTVYSLQDFGDVVQELSGLSPRGEVYSGFELWFGDAETIYGAHHDVSFAPTVHYFRWRGGKRKKIGWTHGDVENKQDPPSEVPLLRPSLQAIGNAYVSEYRSPSARLIKRRKIEFDGATTEIKLGAGHHQYAQILGSPDPGVFVVLSHQLGGSSDGSAERMEPHMYDRHVVDLVNIEEETATRLAKGKGNASVAWAPDGTLYLETNDGISRYPSGEADPHDDVIDGLHLELPNFPQDSDGV